MSKLKQDYLLAPKQSRQLSAFEINSVLQHYNQEKGGIKIYKNGETPIGQEMIYQKKSQIVKQIEALGGDNKSYYLLKDFKIKLDYAEVSFRFLNEETSKKLKNLLKDFLDSSDMLRNNLSLNEIQEIQKIIDKDESLKDGLAKHAERYANFLGEKINDCCLSEAEARREVTWIQEQLKENQKVGYVYTNGVNLGKRHFEAIVLTKTECIKPVTWQPESYLIFNLENERQVPTVRFDSTAIVNSDKGSRPPVPQADGVGCGTLSVMYLKQLLKDDGAQLEKHSLTFPYYEKDGSVSWFFYPPPQVLKYSQSGLYNSMIESMLKDENTAQTIKHKDKEFSVATIKGLLERSIELAEKNGDKAVIEHNKGLLNHLGAFREAWLQSYKESNLQREAMNDKKGQNKYLAYATNRIEKLVSKPDINETQYVDRCKQLSEHIHFVTEKFQDNSEVQKYKDLSKTLEQLSKNAIDKKEFDNDALKNATSEVAKLDKIVSELQHPFSIKCNQKIAEIEQYIRVNSDESVKIQLTQILRVFEKLEIAAHIDSRVDQSAFDEAENKLNHFTKPFIEKCNNLYEKIAFISENNKQLKQQSEPALKSLTKIMNQAEKENNISLDELGRMERFLKYAQLMDTYTKLIDDVKCCKVNTNDTLLLNFCNAQDVNAKKMISKGIGLINDGVIKDLENHISTIQTIKQSVESQQVKAVMGAVKDLRDSASLITIGHKNKANLLEKHLAETPLEKRGTVISSTEKNPVQECLATETAYLRLLKKFQPIDEVKTTQVFKNLKKQFQEERSSQKNDIIVKELNGDYKPKM